MSFTELNKSGYAILNTLSKQILGADTTTAVSLSDFVSVGQGLLSQRTDAVLGEVMQLVTNRIFKTKKYTGRFKLVYDSSGTTFNNRYMVTKFYPSDGFRQSADYNCDGKTNFANGYDNGTNSGNSLGSMWEQKYQHSFTLNYGERQSWQKNITILENQMDEAFQSPEELAKWVGGIMSEYNNDIELAKEAFAKEALLNRIAGVYELATRSTNAVATESAVNLTKLFNDAMGTNYTSLQLRTDYLKDFMEFFAVTFRRYSDWLTHRSNKFHWSVPQQFTIVEDGTSTTVTKEYLTWADYSQQRAVVFKDFIEDCKAQILPEIFHPELFPQGHYELVDYWQYWDTLDSRNGSVRPSIKVYPAIPDTTDLTAGQTTVTTAVEIPFLVGCIFTEGSVSAFANLQKRRVTPVEARKGYYNIWDTWQKSVINDFTEPCVVFYMADEASA